MKTDLFQSHGHCWVFHVCWHIECSTFTVSCFRVWNSSNGIPSPPLALFIVMLPRPTWLRIPGCLTLGGLWRLSGLWRFFLYSSVYSCFYFEVLFICSEHLTKVWNLIMIWEFSEFLGFVVSTSQMSQFCQNIVTRCWQTGVGVNWEERSVCVCVHWRESWWLVCQAWQNEHVHLSPYTDFQEPLSKCSCFSLHSVLNVKVIGPFHNVLDHFIIKEYGDLEEPYYSVLWF